MTPWAVGPVNFGADLVRQVVCSTHVLRTAVFGTHALRNVVLSTECVEAFFVFSW